MERAIGEACNELSLFDLIADCTTFDEAMREVDYYKFTIEDELKSRGCWNYADDCPAEQEN
jgi:hypothetical protein